MAGGAAVNVIIKSGTNRLHGTAWGYDTNSHFTARTSSRRRPGTRRGRLGRRDEGTRKPKNIPDSLPVRRQPRRPDHQGQAVLLRQLRAVRPAKRGLARSGFVSIADRTRSATRRLQRHGRRPSTTRPPTPTPRCARRSPATPSPPTASTRRRCGSSGACPRPTWRADYVNNFTAQGKIATSATTIDFKLNYAAELPSSRCSPATATRPRSSSTRTPWGRGRRLRRAAASRATRPADTHVAARRRRPTPSARRCCWTPTSATRTRSWAPSTDIDTNFGSDGQDGHPRDQRPGPPAGRASRASRSPTGRNLGNANTGNPFQFNDKQYSASVNLQ